MLPSFSNRKTCCLESCNKRNIYICVNLLIITVDNPQYLWCTVTFSSQQTKCNLIHSQWESKFLEFWHHSEAAKHFEMRGFVTHQVKCVPIPNFLKMSPHRVLGKNKILCNFHTVQCVHNWFPKIYKVVINKIPIITYYFTEHNPDEKNNLFLKKKVTECFVQPLEVIGDDNNISKWRL